MRCAILMIICLSALPAAADTALLKAHCSRCHSGDEPEGDFAVSTLAAAVTADTVGLWESSLDYVRAGEMPPADESRLLPAQREEIVQFLEAGLRAYNRQQTVQRVPVRRLNNREFENSIRDVLLIEDVGTHLPTANLIGDSLHHGFDTHGDTLGFSKFHLEQYLESTRRIVDATILSTPRPPSQTYRITPRQIAEAHTSQNTTRPERRGTRDRFDFLDPLKAAYFEPFEVVPETGWYRIRIRCTGRDRGRYPSEETGMYDADPIQLTVQMGGRSKTFDLPDDDVVELELKEWLAAGTRLRLRHPTDGLRMRGNGNFKFQNAITGHYLEQHNPDLFQSVLASARPARNGRKRSAYDWHHWVDHWMGPRPQILSAEVVGPTFEQWPPQRQTRLLGSQPELDQATRILLPIARRAWRREVLPEELDPIVTLVREKAKSLGVVEALKEGVVAILVSPPFLLVDQPQLSDDERFAARLSRFFHSTGPSDRLRRDAAGWTNYEDVRRAVASEIADSEELPFLTAFPTAWLELNDINFMAPDPDTYRHYHRKRVSEDMVREVLTFFRHVVKENRPVPELLTADYSFVNADLAVVYGLSDVPADSTLRRYQFSDGRRGGLLGMGAFLTITADSLGTSPIHRAVYVMENFLGLHPDPPPADVEIQEPDVRSARTIREVLAAHRSDKSCAACHRSIDPWGYAFENFDPVGGWRDVYQNPEQKQGPSKGGIPVDASAEFRSGTRYRDIVQFREVMRQPASRNRFVRCFVVKLLMYANGVEPTDFTEVDRIVSVSAAHEYRMIDTIAAVIDSPLFREAN
ncbi:MAG: DUF1588 domain-containing protein [Planctomycetaceae bacterium]|nr:DUF1588 domain-containing protein [Planctomycetaceae bacterium]